LVEEKKERHSITLSFSDEWWAMASKAMDFVNSNRKAQNLPPQTIDDVAKSVVVQNFVQLMAQIESVNTEVG
jgi:hypothetical protein